MYYIGGELRGKEKYLLLLLVLLITILSCSKGSDKLRIGLIKPSIDHLPLSYALDNHLLNPKLFEVIYFTSGWETQEAIISKKIDLAIIPFTYIWTARSKGYPIQCISFFERETDGIVVNKDIKQISDLNNKKIGVLKASTIDVFLKDFCRKNQVTYTPVYFRTPSEMVAALKSNEVSAIVSYVPVIQKIGDDYSTLHWFSEDYPQHPCCDIALVEGLSLQKKKNVRKLISIIDNISRRWNISPEIRTYAQEKYQLSEKQVNEAFEHSKFIFGLDNEGINFEMETMKTFKEMGYIEQIPSKEKIFNKDFL